MPAAGPAGGIPAPGVPAGPCGPAAPSAPVAPTSPSIPSSPAVPGDPGGPPGFCGSWLPTPSPDPKMLRTCPKPPRPKKSIPPIAKRA
ncbi:MAG: hypothetical protein MPL62_04485 [Alphaproteobacteria bacterium]|nr:hypothetical protein [Alphaproteobacteria bacterium]